MNLHSPEPKIKYSYTELFSILTSRGQIFKLLAHKLNYPYLLKESKHTLNIYKYLRALLN